MKLKSYILSAALGLTAAGVATSCDDMLDKGNDYVIYADDHQLVNPSDTVTSVLGIINKLQAIAVRTNLLGEVRADLVKVNSNATTDLKALASGEIDDDNMYNAPSDYYAVINNCNYFLSKADSTAGNSARNELYFEREIAQVHSIRAWTYLQLVQVYGKVPLVTEPIVTKLQSEASYPIKDIAGICEYFIDDLKPYYATEYPDYNTIGGDIDPKMCFFPTQVVMGDLYLWLAAATQDAEMAKNAAKCYYDYIVWDLSGKGNTYTNTDRWYWSDSNLYNGTLRSPSSSTSSSSTWGSTYCENITKIPMDSAAADGYYNELRNLYNTTYVTEFTEASISPSDYLIELNESQTYMDYDTYSTVVTVQEGDLTDEALESHYLGDLRFQKDYSERTVKSGTKEYDYQTIQKHNSQHISIYRTPQLYLRLAEALNYAGYPRFARQILVMGLNNDVIEYEVSPYYVTDADAAFIEYFQFNNNSFYPRVNKYTQSTNSYGILTSTSRTLYESSNSSLNMWGIHSRGCGLAFLNDDYAALSAPDSTSYPFELLAAIPAYPKAPTTVENPGDSLSYEEWCVDHVYSDSTRSHNKYNEYAAAYPASLTAYQEYVVAAALYADSLSTYENAVEAYVEAHNSWYDVAYADASFIAKEQTSVDQAILDEQALELSYEGNRFYDLMRRALWWNKPTIMSETIGNTKLSSKSGWFLNWDGQIGFDVE